MVTEIAPTAGQVEAYAPHVGRYLICMSVWCVAGDDDDDDDENNDGGGTRVLQGVRRGTLAAVGETVNVAFH